MKSGSFCQKRVFWMRRKCELMRHPITITIKMMPDCRKGDDIIAPESKKRRQMTITGCKDMSRYRSRRGEMNGKKGRDI